MRKTLFILSFTLFTLSIANAQNDKLNYLKSIGDNDPIFETDTFPAKWKNESAVILADKLVADLYEATPMIGYRAQHRTRILLMDAAAVKDFSFFYFDENVNKKIKKDKDYYTFDSLQILVKKANGTSTLVDLKTAIKEEQVINIPELYRKRYFKTSSYYKIAIANLEPGDIIDFCTTRKILFPIDYVINSISFPDIDYTLDDVYHTVQHKLVVKTPTKAKANKFGFTLLYLNTYNGAPPIKQENVNDVLVCTLEAPLLPKSKYERWQYPYLSVPSVKGYLTYINASERNLNMYKQFPNAVPFGRTSVITMDHIYATMNFNTKYYEYIPYSDRRNITVNQSYHISDVRDYLMTHHPEIKDPVELVKAAFYYLRNMSLDPDWNYDNENFMRLIRQMLDDQFIKYTYLITVPKSYSTLDNVLLRDDLHVLLKMKLPNKDTYTDEEQFIYLSNINDYLNFGELETQYQGAEAYEYSTTPSPSIRKVNIPVIDYTDNGIREETVYTIDPNLELITAESQVTIKGSLKKEFNDSLVFKSEFMRYDKIAFKDPNFVFPKTEEAKEKENAKINQEKKINFRKNSIRQTMSIESYDEFELLQDGRIFDKQDIIFKEKYKLKDLISTTGGKHLFAIGKLIGKQLEIKENEMNRKTDIYMDAARFYQYDITVNIPDGYQLQNIEKLNINAGNETGTFQSFAKLQNNKLTITVSKIYYHNAEKKEDWSKMTAFLDACYDFTQTKVFLVRK